MHSIKYAQNAQTLGALFFFFSFGLIIRNLEQTNIAVSRAQIGSKNKKTNKNCGVIIVE